MARYTAVLYCIPRCLSIGCVHQVKFFGTDRLSQCGLWLFQYWSTSGVVCAAKQSSNICGFFMSACCKPFSRLVCSCKLYMVVRASAHAFSWKETITSLLHRSRSNCWPGESRLPTQSLFSQNSVALNTKWGLGKLDKSGNNNRFREQNLFVSESFVVESNITSFPTVSILREWSEARAMGLDHGWKLRGWSAARHRVSLRIRLVCSGCNVPIGYGIDDSKNFSFQHVSKGSFWLWPSHSGVKSW